MIASFFLHFLINLGVMCLALTCMLCLTKKLYFFTFLYISFVWSWGWSDGMETIPIPLVFASWLGMDFPRLYLLYSSFFFFSLYSPALFCIVLAFGEWNTYCFLDTMLQTLAYVIDRLIYWGRLVRGGFRHRCTVLYQRGMKYPGQRLRAICRTRKKN